jgi:predicted DCC family thiol-disulfide oxidoreductase YuxK
MRTRVLRLIVWDLQGISMTTDVKTSEKILAYDGDCPMCRATVALLLRLKLVRPEQLRSNHELEGADLEAAQRAGIRNELVVLDPASGETRAGSDGLLWIIGENTNHHLLVRLLGLPGIRQIVRWKYEAISYNRRVISPPGHQIVCDCEPDVTVGRRLTLIVPLVVMATAIVAGFGAAVFAGGNIGAAPAGAVFAVIAGGLGWVVMIAAGLVLLRGMLRVDYAAHLAVTLFAGALVLVPAMLLTLVLPWGAAAAVDALAVLAAFALMFAMQRRRVAALGLGRGWLWAWAIVLVAAVVGSIVSHFRAEIF